MDRRNERRPGFYVEFPAWALTRFAPYMPLLDFENVNNARKSRAYKERKIQHRQAAETSAPQRR
ncbi:hypothetical protein SB30_190163 [Klebsiella quasipneumoniae subsp. similipneumoniae]|nr:hypothetical protein SB30_190163 [Klebsiella quasipneumoniae subsp. similipneumoniae]